MVFQVSAPRGIFSNNTVNAVNGTQNNTNYSHSGPHTASNGTVNVSNDKKDIKGPTNNHYDGRGSIHLGDSYDGPIYGSSVGGKEHTITVDNRAKAAGHEDGADRDRKPSEERAYMHASCERKKARRIILDRIRKIEEDLAAARKELEKLDDYDDETV